MRIPGLIRAGSTFTRQQLSSFSLGQRLAICILARALTLRGPFVATELRTALWHVFGTRHDDDELERMWTAVLNISAYQRARRWHE